ncbi:MAG: hypothetical protein KJ017_04355 [Alphaproteobacteria bacterium]|nr:hypothetical protein [Alphaproteobacteria bacterium]
MTRYSAQTLTSYDLLKVLAIVLTIIDHTGHHFFPDEMWLRILGRLCVPIWFFLVGYARTEEISRSLIAGGAVVAASALIAGQYLFPLNILITIAILRRLRTPIAMRATAGPENLRGWFLLLLFAAVPTGLFSDYGSMGMLFVLHGYMMRRREVLSSRLTDTHIALFAGFSYLAFGLQQGLMLPSLSVLQAVGLMVGLAGIGLLLHRFKPVDFPKFSKMAGFMGRAVIGFTGRQTLWIYVVHIVLFRAVCMVIYPEQYVFLGWEILPPGMMYLLMKKGLL